MRGDCRTHVGRSQVVRQPALHRPAGQVHEFGSRNPVVGDIQELVPATPTGKLLIGEERIVAKGRNRRRRSAVLMARREGPLRRRTQYGQIRDRQGTHPSDTGATSMTSTVRAPVPTRVDWPVNRKRGIDPQDRDVNGQRHGQPVVRSLHVIPAAPRDVQESFLHLRPPGLHGDACRAVRASSAGPARRRPATGRELKSSVGVGPRNRRSRVMNWYRQTWRGHPHPGPR